jgi:mRNA interferase MazF
VAFDQWTVVVVPFPFTDRSTKQRRPAVVVSRPKEFGVLCGHSVLAMVTSAAHRTWPLDVPISDLGKAGLPAPSLVRMKLFTLDDRLIERQAGVLADADAAAIALALTKLLGGGEG